MIRIVNISYKLIYGLLVLGFNNCASMESSSSEEGLEKLPQARQGESIVNNYIQPNLLEAHDIEKGDLNEDQKRWIKTAKEMAILWSMSFEEYLQEAEIFLEEKRNSKQSRVPNNIFGLGLSRKPTNFMQRNPQNDPKKKRYFMFCYAIE